jgi:sensor domain CHASE-containing protein/two-component sensor histidine kinase
VKVSTRTLAILAATVFFLVITLFVVANGFIQSTYSHVELQQSDANTQLVADNIRYEAEQLGNKARDWAVWDDSYRFMEDNNAHYRDSVIGSQATYESLQVSGLILYDDGGKVVSSQGYDLRNKTLTSLSEPTLAEFSKTLSVLSNTRGGKKKQGIVLLPDGPVLVGMHTILQTNGMGSGHGTLVMIQPFDEPRITSIRSRLHLPISVWRLDQPEITRAPDIAALSGNGAPSSISRIQDPSTMEGLFLVSDIENRPALLVRIETPRTASQQMLETLMYLIVAFIIIGIIFIIVTGLLLRRYIITPLTDLDAAMKKIGVKGDLSERLHADGDDEIASLKESFNSMLGELQKDEADLKKQGDLLAEAHRKANLYLDIYLDVLTYEILNVTISLQAYAELIRESGDATNREYADRISAALNRNLSVIRNIETISKIYKHPPLMTRINLRTVIEKERQKFPGMDLRMIQDEVMVTADETLGIVFYNILLNSLQFGRDDLFIAITIRDLPDGFVEVTVADNGSGIADDMKPLIFDRFMKGSEKRSSYGLGLHIVKMLIEAYGGTVRADDRVPGHPDDGAAIRFTLKKG